MADKLDSTKKNAKSINALLADQNKLIKEQLRIIKDQAGIDSERLNEQQDISNVLKDQVKSLKFQKAERLSILKSVNSITKIANQNYVTGQNELGTLKGISKLQKDRVGIEADIRNLINARKKIVTDSKSLSIEDQKVQMDIAGSIKDQVDEAVRLKENLIDVEATAKKINKNFGVKSFGVLADVMKKVPGLSALSEPFSTAADGAREMASGIENAAKGGGKGLTKERIKQLGLEKQLGKLSGSAAAQKLKGMSSMRKGMLALRAGFATLGPVIAAALGPAILIAEMLKAIVASDKAAGEMAKGMNMTYTDSVRTRAELTQMAHSQLDITDAFGIQNSLSKGNAITTKGLQETLLSVNKTLGTSTMLSEEMLVQFTQMRKMAGFTNEELMGIASISLATGKDMEAITGEFMAQATISASQNGVLLNEKDLLKDIGKVSAATTLSFGKNPKLIAEAVATAKALGMEMSKVEGIADSLLDFESSIENELQAELLLGKNINLEKARQAALNNDLATVAREISNQIGDSAEFSKMNRIQQEALAKSVGMNREDLAQTLFVQEQLVGATGKQAEKKEELINASIKAIGLEATQKKLAEDGVKGLENQNSQAEKFQAIMQKIKDVFVQLVTPIMAIVSPIMDILVPALEMVSFLLTPILEAFNGISGIINAIIDPTVSLQETLANMGPVTAGIAAALTAAGIAVTASLVPGLIRAGIAAAMQLPALISGAIAAVTAASAATLGIGAIAIAAGIAGVIAAMSSAGAKAKTMDDGIIPPGYGDRIISTPKGEIALNNQDTVVAGTNLGQGGGGSTDMSTTNALLEVIAGKLTTVDMYEIQ